MLTVCKGHLQLLSRKKMCSIFEIQFGIIEHLKNAAFFGENKEMHIQAFGN